MNQPPLLEVENLMIQFRQQTAVQEISFKLNTGKTLALVGESGSGKSVTALATLGLLPEQAHFPKGSVRWQGQELLGATNEALRRIRGNRVGMIFQEPMTSLNPLHTVEKQIGEAIVLHQGTTQHEARQQTLTLLEQVGIRDASRRLQAFPHELSGGQRQRVMIAMALANKPDLLIADEPTTALDVTVQRQILELLKSLQQQTNMALLLISHDLNLVEHMADDVCVMQQGQVVEQGPVHSVFKSPQHEYTQHLLASIPTGHPQPLPEQTKTILDVDQLKVWFPIYKGIFKRVSGHVRAVDDISFSLKQGETLGIVGESGSGKSTLGFALLKLVNAQGAMTFNGNPIHQLKQKAFRPLRRSIQIVFQDPFGSLNPRMTIAQIVGEGLIVHQAEQAEQHAQWIAQALEDVGLPTDVQHRYPHEFSGGQRQRIAIARALVLRPELIILDEPTSALDRTIQRQILDLLKSLQQKYQLSYIFISHDLAVVKAISHKVVVMQFGKVVEQGAAQQVLEKPQHPYTQSLLQAAFW
ncbi:ABC transporter ATP-binding protein [Zooshikella ganghwensis]|uniref:ABC-type dipeptide transporter n=1 Tax=Zooshikella ganghwensis TaxID=202772 RepID=A0A4P9VQ39_9GAMM|nr:ABC transporter ATP-binding protein [Zooshikella ganghwensis]RDH44494.1 ABC transporter ATP-binding protein [Zooshikella ganghwensis]